MTSHKTTHNDPEQKFAAQNTRQHKADVLDDAVSLDDLADSSIPQLDMPEDLISEEERNSIGGALPSTDDEDNDNDDDDVRERTIPDHFRRDSDDESL